MMVEEATNNPAAEQEQPSEEHQNPPQADTAHTGGDDSSEVHADAITPDHTLADARHEPLPSAETDEGDGTQQAAAPREEVSVEETTPSGEPLADDATLAGEPATAEVGPAEEIQLKKPRAPRKSKAKAEPKEEPEESQNETPGEQEAAADGEKPADDNKRWYVVKVQSGREESIREAIERRVKIEGLEEYFGEILIPVEKEKVLHKGKRVERERKLYPGYIMARVEFNDQILYLFRETSGVGDFVGGGPGQKPLPMTQLEVDRMTGKKTEMIRQKSGHTGAAPYSLGERVRVKEGVFSGMEGDIKEVLEAKEQVRVELFVLGRPVSVELDYWQVELV